MKPPKYINIILWIIAFLFTAAMGRYQRMTGPTYQIAGEAALGGTTFDYSIERTHGGAGDHIVRIPVADPGVEGAVVWKRYKFAEEWHILPMIREGDALVAPLPHQPPAGKLEYQVLLRKGGVELKLPDDAPAVIRFKGDVPAPILLAHVLVMFLALMIAARTAMAAFLNHPTRKMSWLVMGGVVIGGLILGPIVQKYAFDAYWTGWPFGEDLTDNKTAVMALAWALALWRLRGSDGERKGRWWTVAAMVVMFAVFVIPHSMRGSEIDYNKLSADSLRMAQP